MKKVNLIITVPSGEYCWDNNGLNSETCEHFSNEGGHHTCDLGFSCGYKHTYKKPKECLALGDIHCEGK